MQNLLKCFEKKEIVFNIRMKTTHIIHIDNTQIMQQISDIIPSITTTARLLQNTCLFNQFHGY